MPLRQVYSASNVQIVTLRRTEHLTEENLRDLQQQQHTRTDDGGGGNKERGESNPGDIVFPGGARGNPLTSLLQTTATESKTEAQLDASHVRGDTYRFV